ncbi:hypothetical protein ACJIZ3_006188 [Penstemon smallii]|uniref:Uncharacterized protein n=1 Tax=Penstemon smallii TaxID=265156 RepID=A0ABD3S726_9LAMI
MASSDEMPKPMPGGDGSVPPGKPTTMGQHIIDKGAQLIQSLKPIKKMSQHACTFAIYSHDMNRQIETHHYATRLNQDFIQSELKDLAQTYGKFWCSWQVDRVLSHMFLPINLHQSFLSPKKILIIIKLKKILLNKDNIGKGIYKNTEEINNTEASARNIGEADITPSEADFDI